MEPHVWILNLDAEFEFAAPRAYAPRRSIERALAPRLAAARALLAAGDVLLGEGPLPDGARGRAWCPTASVGRRFVEAGVAPEPWPALEIVRHVNGRGFCAELGQTLPQAAYHGALDGVWEHLGRATPGSPWLLKRAFAVAGRGQRRVRAGEESAADRAWVRASLLRGGVQVEPLVEIERELALHGLLERAGAVSLGQVVVQVCARGAWSSTRPAETADLGDAQRAAFVDEARAVAAALTEAGYFGPFGLDGFLWRDGAELRLQPRSEINARYSLGWPVGMGTSGPG